MIYEEECQPGVLGAAAACVPDWLATLAGAKPQAPHGLREKETISTVSEPAYTPTPHTSLPHRRCTTSKCSAPSLRPHSLGSSNVAGIAAVSRAALQSREHPAAVAGDGEGGHHQAECGAAGGENRLEKWARGIAPLRCCHRYRLPPAAAAAAAHFAVPRVQGCLQLPYHLCHWIELCKGFLSTQLGPWFLRPGGSASASAPAGCGGPGAGGQSGTSEPRLCPQLPRP